MKRFLLLALVITGLSQVNYAQYQRMVLLEEFTQASCGPCASQNPGFNAILQANEDKAIILKFQVWWPGFDPMYLQNQPDVDARVGYYGVTGVPHATMDGVNAVNDCGYYTGAPACISADEITTEYGVTSPFQITVTHDFSADYSTINIHVDVTSGSDMTGSLKLRCAVAEKNINFDTPPGSNGETEFLGVMKKMLPDASGTSTGDFYAGETKSYDFSWDLANIYNMNEVEVVAWMQDDATKGIMQAAVSDPIGGLPEIDYAATDVSSIFCTNSFDPVVSVMNNSDDALTAIDVSYSVDGGAASVYNWTGSIAAHASGNINLPTVTVATGGTHALDVELKPVGGAVDINMVNNNLGSNISVLDVTQASVDEGFQDAAWPPENWAVDNLSTGDGWAKATGNVGGYGESTISTKANFYYIGDGNVFDLYAPKMDFSGFTGDLKLVFDRAYAKYNTTYIDELKILVSTNCGDTWTTVYDKFSSDLATASPTTSVFKPEDDEWATDEVDMNPYAGMSDVLIKFQGISGYGNELYIDNVRLASTVGVIDVHALTQFNVYPNPATDAVYASFQLENAADVAITVYDLTGRAVSGVTPGYLPAGQSEVRISTSDLSTGVYNIIVSANGKQVAYDHIVISN